jgi:hypothetical protein
MYFPRDVTIVILEILLNRQTSVSCIICRNIRRAIVRTVTGRILDSPWSRVVNDLLRNVYVSNTIALVPGWVAVKLEPAEAMIELYSCTWVLFGWGVTPGSTLPGCFCQNCLLWIRWKGTYCSFQRWQVQEEIITISCFINGFDSFEPRSNNFGVE